MGILDQIANPTAGQPTGLQNLQVLENLKTRRMQREQMEAQAGLQMRALEKKEEGSELIEQYQAGEPLGGGPVGAPADPAMYNDLFEPLQQVTTDNLSKAESLDDLTTQLAALDDPRAEIFAGMAEKAREFAAEETKEQREQNEQMMSMAGGTIREVSELEEAGNFEQAADRFSQIRDLITQDPRFSENQEIVDFFQTFHSYQPGLGKFMYLSTMYGEKARDQFQKEIDKPVKYDTANLHWGDLERPVAARFNPASGKYEYKKDGEWTEAPDNAEVMGKTVIKGTTEETIGTKKTQAALEAAERNSSTVEDQITTVINGLERAPGAVGITGAGKELAAGLIGQWGEVGRSIANQIESEDDRQVRSGVRMLTGVLVPTITGDTSGRYSDADMKRVEDVNRALKPTSNVDQSISALKTVQEVVRRGRLADQYYKKHGFYPKTQEERDRLFKGIGKKSKFSNLWGD